jgi:hypothetical protein
VKAAPVNWLPWTPFCLSSRASRAPRSRRADDRVVDQLQGDTPGGQRLLWQSICIRSDSKDSRGDERHLQGGHVLGKSLESGSMRRRESQFA